MGILSSKDKKETLPSNEPRDTHGTVDRYSNHVYRNTSTNIPPEFTVPQRASRTEDNKRSYSGNHTGTLTTQDHRPNPPPLSQENFPAKLVLPSNSINSSINRQAGSAPREGNNHTVSSGNDASVIHDHHHTDNGISRLDYVILLENMTQLTDTVKQLNLKVSSLEYNLHNMQHREADLARSRKDAHAADTIQKERENANDDKNTGQTELTKPTPEDVIRKMKEQLRKRRPDKSALEESRNIYKKIRQEYISQTNSKENTNQKSTKIHDEDDNA